MCPKVGTCPFHLAKIAQISPSLGRRHLGPSSRQELEPPNGSRKSQEWRFGRGRNPPGGMPASQERSAGASKTGYEGDTFVPALCGKLG